MKFTEQSTTLFKFQMIKCNIFEENHSFDTFFEDQVEQRLFEDDRRKERREVAFRDEKIFENSRICSD